MKSSSIKQLGIILILLISTAFASFKIVDKSSLLVGSWKQFAFKENNSSDIKYTSGDCSCKTINFNANGIYNEEMYCMESTGKWYFNNNQTKLGFSLEEFNGMNLPASIDTNKITNIIIIKLTEDTLIYGMEAYYGKDKLYGHDDWYFYKLKK